MMSGSSPCPWVFWGLNTFSTVINGHTNSVALFLWPLITYLETKKLKFASLLDTKVDNLGRTFACEWGWGLTVWICRLSWVFSQRKHESTNSSLRSKGGPRKDSAQPAHSSGISQPLLPLNRHTLHSDLIDFFLWMHWALACLVNLKSFISFLCFQTVFFFFMLCWR